jgi:hypothetical protein
MIFERIGRVGYGVKILVGDRIRSFCNVYARIIARRNNEQCNTKKKEQCLELRTAVLDCRAKNTIVPHFMMMNDGPLQYHIYSAGGRTASH